MRWAVTYPLDGFSSFFRGPFLWVLAPPFHTANSEFSPFSVANFSTTSTQQLATSYLL
jgi:hypothetical protein